jgi:hypothetical protein
VDRRCFFSMQNRLSRFVAGNALEDETCGSFTGRRAKLA